MPFQNWSSGETVAKTKLDAMENDVPHIRLMGAIGQGGATVALDLSARTARAVLPDFSWNIGIVPDRYLVVIYSANSDSSAPNIMGNITVFGQHIPWFHDKWMSVSIDTEFHILDMENLAGTLAISDLSGIAGVTFELRGWRSGGTSLDIDHLDIMCGDTDDPEQYLATFATVGAQNEIGGRVEGG